MLRNSVFNIESRSLNADRIAAHMTQRFVYLSSIHSPFMDPQRVHDKRTQGSGAGL